MELNKSTAVDETRSKCGIRGATCRCQVHRSVQGKVKIFQEKHYDKCSEHKLQRENEKKSVFLQILRTKNWLKIEMFQKFLH